MKTSSRYACILMFMCFLTTPCFSNELFEHVCTTGHQICQDNCTRNYNICTNASSESYCAEQHTAEDSPCIINCKQFKEDCANKTKAAE